MKTYGIITDKKEDLGEVGSFIDGKKIALKWLETHIGEVSVCNRVTYAIDTFENSAITKDNIAEYYEFMSEDELQPYGFLIDEDFKTRFQQVRDGLKIKEEDDIYDFLVTWFSACEKEGEKEYILGQYIYDVRDTLKPIDEYISEIKESKEYEAYFGRINLKNTEELKND